LVILRPIPASIDSPAVPSANKRERQRQNRDARREAMLEDAKRRRRFKTGRNVVIALVALGVVFGLVQLTKSDDSSSASSSSSASAVTCDKKTPVNPPKTLTYPDGPDQVIEDGATYEVRLHTSCGDIPIKLDVKQAPKTVNSFLFLVQNEFYNGTTFHRIVTDFVDQGGDPTGTGSGGPGYTLPDEPPKGGTYKVGDVAMANSGSGTTGSQFFLVVSKAGAKNLGATGAYSILGHMTDDGLKVAQKINTFGSADSAGTPTRNIYIFDAGIVFGGNPAKAASSTTTTQP
jgi:peptidyl-prolyl cis-trans isomerase B (cyclophilin B)